MINRLAKRIKVAIGKEDDGKSAVTVRIGKTMILLKTDDGRLLRVSGRIWQLLRTAYKARQ